MKTKFTPCQKERLKKLRTLLAKERKYVPRGQGDGQNQHLRIIQITRDIENVKVNPDYIPYRI